jgi:hypothetical protein
LPQRKLLEVEKEKGLINEMKNSKKNNNKTKQRSTYIQKSVEVRNEILNNN